ARIRPALINAALPNGMKGRTLPKVLIYACAGKQRVKLLAKRKIVLVLCVDSQRFTLRKIFSQGIGSILPLANVRTYAQPCRSFRPGRAEEVLVCRSTDMP